MAQIVIKSTPFSYIPEDIKSVLVGAAIAGSGALLTYMAERLSSLNFGEYTPLIVALLSVLINAIRKYIGTSKYAK